MSFPGDIWSLILTQFHWMRPWWLLAALPAFLIAFLLWRQTRKAVQWQDLVSPDLLPYLIDGKSLRSRPWQIAALLAAWLIACIALAGPAWEKRSLPVQKNQNALVILLDLSPSMLSEDLKPSRLVRARLKILDILRERRDGLTGLLVYSADAHVVTPLSDDIGTIRSLIPSLHPDIMPQRGSNTEAAIARALQLLSDAGATSGDLLLITDGVVEEAQANINKQLQNSGVRLSVLGVGTDMPAPIPGSRGNFVRDQANNIVTTQLDEQVLRQLANQNNGRYARVSGDNRDLDWLLAQAAEMNEEINSVEQEFDSWYDHGYWLIFLLLPIVLYCFRRGVLLVLLCIPASLLYSTESHALGWNDLWFTKDQQAQRALQQGDAKAAAETFEDPQWKASAEYRAGNYEAAAKHFAGDDSAQSHYNRGNAFAKSHKLEEAISAYDEALKRQPEFPEATANRDLVKKLLDQQEQQEQDGDQNQQDQNQEQEQEQNQEQNSSQNQQDGDSEQENDSGQENPSDSQSDSSADPKENNDRQNDGQNPRDNEDTQNPDPDSEQRDENQDEAATDESDAGPEENEEPAQAGQTDEDTDIGADAQQVNLQEGEAGDEQQQALEQWLRRVPDDPSGLLREKFRYQYNQLRNDRLRGNWPAPENESDQRW